MGLTIIFLLILFKQILKRVICVLYYNKRNIERRRVQLCATMHNKFLIVDVSIFLRI